MSVYRALALLAILGCTPAFNWREVSIAATPLVALFPCKAERTSRRLAVGGAEVELHMTHCETAGVTVAIGHARVADPALIAPVLVQWRNAVLAGMRANGSKQLVWSLPRASLQPSPVLLEATGTGMDGKPRILKGAWFARDEEVFAAMLYAQTLDPEVGEAFFSGLGFR